MNGVQPEQIDSPVDLPHVVEVAAGYVDYFLECLPGVAKRPRVLPTRLRSGQKFPHGLSIEVGATLFLADLERAGLLPGLDDPLPTTRSVFESLKARLAESPGLFWSDASVGETLHRKVLAVWSSFDWHRFDSAALAVEFEHSDALLEGLADFLWDNRHLVVDEIPRDATPTHQKSLFDYFKKAGRRTTAKRKANR